MHCVFGGSTNPIILRESCWRESTFQALSAVSLCYASRAMFFTLILNDTLFLLLTVVNTETK